VKRSRFEGNRTFYAAVGRRIAKARTGRLTQEALAEKATLTRTAIVNIEKGRQQILLHTVVEIAQALAIPITDLLPDRARPGPGSGSLGRSKGELVARDSSTHYGLQARRVNRNAEVVSVTSSAGKRNVRT
jgi:transcriptional regulator with XRE-family HTH domain